MCGFWYVYHSFIHPLAFTLGLVVFWTHRVSSLWYTLLFELVWFNYNEPSPKQPQVTDHQAVPSLPCSPYLLTQSPHWTILLHCLFFLLASPRFLYTTAVENNYCDPGKIKNHLFFDSLRICFSLRTSYSVKFFIYFNKICKHIFKILIFIFYILFHTVLKGKKYKGIRPCIIWMLWL